MPKIEVGERRQPSCDEVQRRFPNLLYPSTMNPTIPTLDPALVDFAPDIRFRHPDRSTLVDPRTIDQLIPPDHPARATWQQVCALDFSQLLLGYKARLHHPGKPPIDVRVLVALWLFATDEGIDSARRLSRLCRRDTPYRWICGGILVDYHTLSSFHIDHGDWLRSQCIATVGTLHRDGLVRFDHVGQDGMRVRASAGSDSMKTAPTLVEDLAQAEQRLQTLEAEDRAKAPSPGRRTKKEAARLRGARERCERLRQAVAEIGPLAQTREARKKGDGATTRVSETDPECRRMKMADGGFRPAYNVQFATDLDALVVVGVETINAGNDAGQVAAMQQQLIEDYAVVPKAYSVDGGYVTNKDIEASAHAGIPLYAPIKSEKKQLEKGDDPYARKQGESDEVAAWRQRMSTAEGKAEYRNRGKTEWTNAQARRSGLDKVRVRGLQKVNTVVLWFVLMMTLLRGAKLRQQSAGTIQGAEESVPVAPAAGPGVEKAADPTEGPPVIGTG